MKLKDFFRRYKGKDKKGVTLVELIAVVAILAITSTASVSVFLAVRTSVYNTSKVTTDQFNVIQTEKYIRNEFQVASKIDIYPRDGTSNLPAFPDASHTTKKGDECMVFDATNERVYFFIVKTDGGSYEHRLTIDSVDTVNIKIAPVNYKAAKDYQDAVDAGSPPATNPVKKTKLKMFYEIKGETFTYSGGMLLNNSCAGAPDLAWYTTEPPYCPELLWTSDPDVAVNDNDYILTFHSDYSKDTDTV